MAHEAPADPELPRRGRLARQLWRWGGLGLLALILAAAAIVWIQRENIADNAISDYLESKGVQATYEIESIGPEREVLANIVIGDPAKPDLTIERAEIYIEPRFGLPGIRHVRLVSPRLYATLLDGELSLGALDPLVFTGEEGPFEFPAMVLEIADGRGLVEGDYGPIGVSLSGAGHLRGGFSGELAATAPGLVLGGCSVSGATAYGTVSIDAERPRFKGPFRLASADCGEAGPQLAATTLDVSTQVDRDLGGIEADVALKFRAPELAGLLAEVVEGKGKVTFRGGELTASYDIGGERLSHPQAQLAGFSAEGTVRAGDGFGWLRVESEFSGEGFRPGGGLDEALAGAAENAEGTLVGSVLRKLRGGLLDEATGSALSGEASFSKTDEVASLVVPQASVIGGSGARVLTLSRLQYALRPGQLPSLSGNFATGGQDLPRITGRIEQRGDAGFTARLAMADYRADDGRLAIPELLVRARGDRIAFTGRVLASGALPGGHAEGLILPLDGTWSDAGGLALWPRCTDVRFDSLRYSNLQLDGRSLTLCPAQGRPIVRFADGGLSIAAGAPSLEVTGRLGETPIAIASGPIGFAYPGVVSARQLNVALGPAGTASRFAVTNLTAEIGDDIAGQFEGTDVFLNAVPLDVLGAKGDWRYAGGRLSLTDGRFTLEDREAKDRFNPLVAQGASLALEDNVITANALLREPASGREVTQVTMRHDLSNGAGHADLAVEGIVFDDRLQPETLSDIARGLVALVEGTVTGGGRIDWDEAGNVTSTGSFTTQSLDFAAAFGPVSGASGTIEFTDLLGMTTAPGQEIMVGAINPGIEVYDGVLLFQLIGGTVIQVEDATWPFLGGTLTMRPVRLNFGVDETRTYTLDIAGLEATRFIERMELNNLSATGVFDGTIPLVFDPDGNGRIAGGLLLSRPPGGNVAYVGDLTYEDLGAIANFAFDALRSLDYTRMTIAMDGPLTGQIVTRVRFDGVSQGEGAKQNLITKQIGKLPFRFDVNVRASFYELLTNLRSIYDPAAVRDPRELGLIDAEGNPIRRRSPGPGLSIPPEDLPPRNPQPGTTPDEAVIQRSESEEVQ